MPRHCLAGVLFCCTLMLFGCGENTPAQRSATFSSSATVFAPASAPASEPVPASEPAPASEPVPMPPPQTGSATGAASPPAAPPAAPAARPTALTVRTVSASGEQTDSSSGAEVDYSNAAEGYVMVKYKGSNAKVKLQLTGPNKVTYTYSLSKSRGWDAFPLTSGSGSYTLNVFENISGSQYALALGSSFSTQLNSALLPYLYPNQYVSFTSQSTAVAKGEALAATAATELEVVGNVYAYVTKNVRYDDDKAAKVADGRITAPYLPSPDVTLAEQKGICFDYAALMATMLRTQNIPTRMELGYVSGGIYHAWISVYITEIGWINGVIQFDGTGWKLMDPTFASSGGASSQIMQFIGNGSNYSTKFVY